MRRNGIEMLKAAIRRISPSLGKRRLEGDDAFLERSRGVIHVGANSGQERGVYAQLGLPVIWIEPNPDVFRELAENIRPFPRQRAFERLVSDIDGGEYQFHVANNYGLSSSILDLKLHRDIWPQVEYERTLTLRSITLDTLLTAEQVKTRRYDALVLDTQGSELLVLKGATKLLGGIRFVKVEVPDFESYADCCQISDVEAFLASFGFREHSRSLFAQRSEGGTYYDIVYGREAINMSYKKLLGLVVPPPIRLYFRDIQQRLARLEAMEPEVRDLRVSVATLETTLDTLMQSPVYTPGEGVGFNGQMGRKQIFSDILASVHPAAIVETGTWVGNTSAYMAEVSGLPVISTELNGRFHSLARLRLANHQGVDLRHGDSRRLLSELSADPRLTDVLVLFYLDAHWYDDLPLREEIALIATKWKRFVIMIDDFAVPGDAEYGYDDFGPGKALTMDYIKSSLDEFRLAPFFPSSPAENETGARRGCVVLAPDGPIAESLAEVRSLKRA